MPSSSEWEDHKSQILALIAENQLTLVIETMKQHGFTASYLCLLAVYHATSQSTTSLTHSKAQYEQQLVKWNARKNLKKGGWRAVITVYDRLVHRHGERNVRLLISGTPVEKKRIAKNRCRYCREESRTMDLVTDSDGHLPRGVSFQVLRANGEWMSLPPDELQTERSSTAGIPMVSNRSILPASLREAADPEEVIDVTIPDAVPSPSFSAFMIWENLEDPVISATAASDPIPTLSFVEQRPGSLSPFNFSPVQLNFSPIVWPDSISANSGQKTPEQILLDLGFFRFEKRLLEGTGATNLHTWLAGHVHFLQSPTIQFLSCVKVSQRSPFELLGTQLAGHHYVHSLMQPFMSMLPGKDLSTAQNVMDFDAHIHRLLLFSFANRFSGLEMVDLTRVLGFLSQYKNIGSLLMQLKGIPGPYSKAIAVGLFKLCVESGEAQAVQQLLEIKKINVNTIFLTHNGQRFTPLERASQLQDADMVYVLLANGADVNKSYEPQEGPLTRLIYGVERGTTINTVAQRAVFQLLDAGARVEWRVLEYVLYSLHAKGVAFRLTLTFLDQNTEASLPRNLLLRAAKELDEEQMSKVLKSVVSRHGLIKGRDPGQSREQIHQVLVECAAKGHLRLVEMLLPHHAYPVTDVLCGAIRGHHKDLAETIVSEYGPSLDSESHNIDLPTHPLITAIAAEDDDLIRLCEGNGSLSRLQDRHFTSAMNAAASTGNFRYVRRLLEIRRHPDPLQLTRPLLYAIQGGYKDIAFMLLEAGADVNLNTNFKNSPPDPFMAAILRGDRSLVHAIMDANFAGCPGDWYESFCPCYEVDGEETTILSALIRLGDQSLITKALHVIPNHLRLQESDVEGIMKERQQGMFQFLLEQKPFRHTAATARLKFAAASNDWTTVREMLGLGANPGNLGVLIAAADTSQEMFQFLFEKVSWSLVPCLDDSDSSGEYGWNTCGACLLEHVIKKGVSALPLLAFIIKTGRLDLNDLPARPYLTPLGAAIAACSDGRSHGLTPTRMLLEAGCNPNAIIIARGYVSRDDSSTDGNLTPILLAIQLKRTDLVALLLEKHADVNKEAILGIQRTPLQMAAELGCLEIVKLLLSNGADVNAQPAFRAGGTALQLAAISGNCNIACVLLEHGADLHQPPRILGRWPLEGAAEHGRLEMIDYLWRVSDGKGFSDEICDRAIELAGYNGHEACQDLIRDLKISKSPSTCGFMSGALAMA
ncbi:hypothetical protein PG991_014674 [Apiospora marii]|uniref:Clr5 domain-containing protein n=1 Tax=Apiospora marii TaxID=335849 RepID=A0ABR1R481_9PEZI